LNELNIGGNELQQLPESIGALENLDTFEAKKNKLQSLPNSLGNLKKLRKINLDENQLQVVQGFFTCFENLVDLSMTKN
jgi:Leucine-rich repeat (LRR) protein